MHSSLIIRALAVLDPVLLACALVLLFRNRLARRYVALTSFIAFHLLSTVLLYALLYLLPQIPYKIYFYAYWLSSAAEAGLTLWCVGQMFSIALSPLSGIRRLASATFGCICTLSVLIAAAMTISSSATGSQFLMQIVSQVTRFESMLVLSMLVFLAFAAHMLGLSYKSRIFSISLAFGVWATVSLFNSALMTKTVMSSQIALTLGLFTSLPLLIMNFSLALPEPARRLITVPVDSWMLRWNDIAKSFGHGPAAVVVGEDPLQMMHPNEVLMHQRVMSSRAAKPKGALTQTSRA